MNKTQTGLMGLAFIATGSLLSGCSTEVSYGDAKETETVTVEYGSTDLQSLASKRAVQRQAQYAVPCSDLFRFAFNTVV